MGVPTKYSIDNKIVDPEDWSGLKGYDHYMRKALMQQQLSVTTPGAIMSIGQDQTIENKGMNFRVVKIDNGFLVQCRNVQVYCATAKDVGDQVIVQMALVKLEG